MSGRLDAPGHSPAARLGVFLGAVQQILAPIFIFPRGFGGFTAAESVPTPAEPAAYAFGIWGVIYTSCLIYAVLQLLPRYGHSLAFAAIRVPTILLFAGSTAWLLFARYGPTWMTVVVIWGMLACALYAMVRLARWPTPLPAHVKLLVGWPLAIYAGWLSAAAFVNSASVLPFWGTGTAGLGPDGLGVLMILMAAGTVALVLNWARAPFAYLLTILWALAAIALANSGLERGRILDNSAPDSPAVLWTALAAGAAVVAAFAAARMRRLRVAHA